MSRLLKYSITRIFSFKKSIFVPCSVRLILGNLQMRVVYSGNLSVEGGDTTFGPESSIEGGVERPLLR